MLLSYIAGRIGGQLEGPDLEVVALAAPEKAHSGQLVVVRESKFLESAIASGAALIVDSSSPCPPSVSCIRVPSVTAVWPTVLALFDPPRPWNTPGIHPTAVIDPSANLAATATVGPYAVIGPEVRVGALASVGAYVYLGQGSVVGEGSVLEPRVTLHPFTFVGANCLIGTGTVLGGVGFGFQDGKRLPHTGRVVIEQSVELGCNCVVQRSVVGDTRIGAESKIGDMTEVGHNVQIGRGVVMVGNTTIGGSSVIEDGVMMGGWVVISDHVRIERGAKVAGGSGISKKVPAGQTWASGIPAKPIREHWRRLALLDWLVEVERSLKWLLNKQQG